MVLLKSGKTAWYLQFVYQVFLKVPGQKIASIAPIPSSELQRQALVRLESPLVVPPVEVLVMPSRH